MIANVGSMSNKGVEVLLNGTAIQKDIFRGMFPSILLKTKINH